MAADGGTQLATYLRAPRTPEQKMPTFPVSDTQAADISAYLRSLAPARGAGGGRGGIEAVVVGDPKAGETYFNSRGCTTCHSVTGDLKGIGSRQNVMSIQGRIVVPRGGGGYPRGFNSTPPANEPPITVTISQPNGTKVSGTLLWITDFNVTFVDASGVRRTVARDGDVPKVEITDPLKWHIDHMKTLTDKDLHDLTAYLVTLK
jgi:cytochrome c2